MEFSSELPKDMRKLVDRLQTGVLHGKAVHRGKQAHTAQAQFAESAPRALDSIGRERVEHEVTPEAVGVSLYRLRDGPRC